MVEGVEVDLAGADVERDSSEGAEKLVAGVM